MDFNYSDSFTDGPIMFIGSTFVAFIQLRSTLGKTLNSSQLQRGYLALPYKNKMCLLRIRIPTENKMKCSSNTKYFPSCWYFEFKNRLNKSY